MLLLRSTVRCFTVSVATLLTGMVLAQTRFNYQAVVRYANDTIVPNQEVLVELSLHEDAEAGPIVFQETHEDSTSSIGLLNLLVGAGALSPGYDPLDSVQWGLHQYFLQVRVDMLDGNLWREMGTAPVASVPVAEYARNASNGHWVATADGIVYTGGSVGIGVDNPIEDLDVAGKGYFHGLSHLRLKMKADADGIDNYLGSFDYQDQRKWLVVMRTGQGESFSIFSDEADDHLLTVQPDGRTQVKCLEILGGCDINERFNSTETLEPGTIVIADPDRPGQVCQTGRPYDQRVVGAISGANGIKPGLTLTQEGTALDGTHPVALDGRVYVKVIGPVKVGDLLTTSKELGKAMAVKNRRKAFGAVIGKALESDADGDGLVLMLVQPR